MEVTMTVVDAIVPAPTRGSSAGGILSNSKPPDTHRKLIRLLIFRQICPVRRNARILLRFTEAQINLQGAILSIVRALNGNEHQFDNFTLVMIKRER
jgi:hypothetical protein